MRFPRRGRCIRPPRESRRSGQVARAANRKVCAAITCSVWGAPTRSGRPNLFTAERSCVGKGVRRLLKFGCCSWASSSAGRAPRSQRGGRGFESPLVHHLFKRTYIILRNRVLLVLPANERAGKSK